MNRAATVNQLIDQLSAFVPKVDKGLISSDFFLKQMFKLKISGPSFLM